jgi:hypothetical protein
VDTGVLVAAANRRDPDFGACSKLLREASPPLLVPAPVLGETLYLIGKQLGASIEAAFLRSLAEERYHVEVPTDEDLRRAADLVERYADLPLGGTDALVVATAERLGHTEVASLDHRHFQVVRPAHVERLRLLP